MLLLMLFSNVFCISAEGIDESNFFCWLGHSRSRRLNVFKFIHSGGGAVRSDEMTAHSPIVQTPIICHRQRDCLALLKSPR